MKKEAEYFEDIVILPFLDRYDLVVLKTFAICEYGVSFNSISLMCYTQFCPLPSCSFVHVILGSVRSQMYREWSEKGKILSHVQVVIREFSSPISIHFISL
jgi:hypothetical protein